MKNITVRGLDPELEEKLKQAARKDGKSVNQVVLDALKKQFGLEKERRFTTVHRDMDHLFGRWSEEEFEQIQGKIDSERKVDEELWR